MPDSLGRRTARRGSPWPSLGAGREGPTNKSARRTCPSRLESVHVRRAASRNLCGPASVRPRSPRVRLRRRWHQNAPRSPASRFGRAARVKVFLRNSGRTHRPQLELATIPTLCGTGALLTQHVALQEAPAESRDPSGQEVAHRFLRRAVRAGERAVRDDQDEASTLRVKEGDLQTSPTEEGRGVHETPRVREGERGTGRHNGLERIHPVPGTPLPGEIQDALRGPADRLLELSLDIHDRLRAADHGWDLRETKP